MAQGKSRVTVDVKLIMGILASSRGYLKRAYENIQGQFGPMDLMSDIVPFTYTDFYVKEMGDSILRQYVSFEDLVDPGTLREVKSLTNRMEESESVMGKRVMNLDPGYLTVHAVLLASTKEAAHRVYLGEGIYGQPMLKAQGGGFMPFEFTYPDYADKKTRVFFLGVRERYREQLRGRALMEDGGANSVGKG